MATKRPELVYRNGKPAAVILDIDEYREMLERLEDAEDLRVLRRMRAKPLKLRKLDEFLAARSARRGAELAS
jgi:PHD/YefM family antitoxin component YafN of YafNO toxin-antitoxin module